jgi:hypothetical protein
MYNPASSTDLRWFNGSDRIVLDASGNLGVGTASPGGRLEVAKSGPCVIYNKETSVNVTAKWVSTDGSLSLFGTESNHPQTFITNDTERARITSGGALLVGRTTEMNGHTFQSGGGASTYRTSSVANNGVHHFYSDFSSTENLVAYITANGGLSNYSGNNVNLSDERVKTDIEPIGSVWDKVKSIEIVAFKYKNHPTEKNNIGVIAQQVESVAPEFVNNDGFGETPEDGVPLKTIYTTDMHHAAIKALQEAMARIEQLEADVAALKGT